MASGEVGPLGPHGPYVVSGPRDSHGYPYGYPGPRAHHGVVGPRVAPRGYPTGPPYGPPPIYGPRRVVRPRRDCNKMAVMGVIALILGVCGIIAVSVPFSISRQQPLVQNASLPIRVNTTRYGIVIDAGSSGTRMYVYSWDAAKTPSYNGTPIVEQLSECIMNKGMSSFATNTTGAGMLLDTCLPDAMRTIPSSHQMTTIIRLAGTAGMRLLREKNATQAEDVMAAIRFKLRSYPFSFADDNVRILSDVEEGLFAWITANYLNVKHSYIKQFRSDATGTIGALDMGGASTQITFVPDPSEPDLQLNYTRTVNLFGQNFATYSYSFLCYGKNEAEKRLEVKMYKQQAGTQANNSTITVNNPCAPQDSIITRTYGNLFDSTCTQADADPSLKSSTFTFRGTSNPAACSAQVQNLFEKTPCTFKRCSIGGVYQPKLRGVFLGLSGYYYDYIFFNFTLASFKQFNDTVYAYCSMSNAQVLAMYNNTSPDDKWRLGNPAFLPFLCFEGFYTIQILQSFGFDSSNWENVVTTTAIGGTTVGWPMGLLLNEISPIPPFNPKLPPPSTAAPPLDFPLIVFIVLICLFIICTLMAIGFFCSVGKYRDENCC